MVERRFDAENREKLLNAERRERWAPSRFPAQLNLEKGQTVLDAGCGPGFWMLPLAEAVGLGGGCILASDVSREMLAELDERHSPSHVRLLREELPTIHLLNGSADWIWAAFVFHQVEVPGRL